MTKPAMPDPAGFVKSFSLFALKNLSDQSRLYTEIQRCADDDFTAPLYTTGQAEAYASARAKEALAEVAALVDERRSNGLSTDLRGIASAIRRLSK